MSDAAIRVHLERLIAMEYVRAAAGKNGQRFEYELLFDGDPDAAAPQMIGLIDVAALSTTTATSQGRAPDLARRLQAARTELAPTLQSSGNAANAGQAASSDETTATECGNVLPGRAVVDGRSLSRAPRASAPSSSSLLAASGS